MVKVNFFSIISSVFIVMIIMALVQMTQIRQLTGQVREYKEVVSHISVERAELLLSAGFEELDFC